MKNLLNIDDEVKVVMPGVFGDGQIVKVAQIDMISGELYYMGTYHQDCPQGGEGYDTTVQFKEGQYELIGSVPNPVDPKVAVITVDSAEKVRCKFECNYVEHQGDTDCIKLAPTYTGSEENKQFFKYTPGGDIGLYVVNPEAAKLFEIGKEYYVDFIPAE